MRSRYLCLMTAPCAVFLLGCGKEPPQARPYHEVRFMEADESAPAQETASTAPAVSPAGDPSVSSGMSLDALPPAVVEAAQSASLVWTVPPGWTDAGPSGMRLATLTSPAGTQTTVIQLGGQAGSIEANLSRWLGQVGVSVPADELRAFVESLPALETAGGDAGVFADLTSFNREPTDEGVMASIIQNKAGTVFIKMTGKVAALETDRPALLDFTQSLRMPSS